MSAVFNDIGVGLLRAKNQSQSKALRDWEEYAAKLERSLKEQKEETFGQAGIKAAALKEIARIDPNNPLLQQEVRKAIAERSIEEAKKAGKID